MMAFIAKPDYEARLAILRAKAKTSNFTPSNETIEYLALNIEENIRELEGVLNSIIASVTLKSATYPLWKWSL